MCVLIYPCNIKYATLVSVTSWLSINWYEHIYMHCYSKTTLSRRNDSKTSFWNTPKPPWLWELYQRTKASTGVSIYTGSSLKWSEPLYHILQCSCIILYGLEHLPAYCHSLSIVTILFCYFTVSDTFSRVVPVMTSYSVLVLPVFTCRFAIFGNWVIQVWSNKKSGKG